MSEVLPEFALQYEFVMGMDAILPFIPPDLKNAILGQYAQACADINRFDASKMSPNLVTSMRHLYLFTMEIRGEPQEGHPSLPIDQT